MSRHRNLRKVSLGDDDYDDELAQSYDEKYSYAVSPGTSEMYMFNRSSESQNISQFIKGGIVEEEDQEEQDSEALEMSSSSNLKSASGLNVQNDEMFQMDKEPQSAQDTASSAPTTSTKLKSKDDLESLINETSTLFNSQTISIGDNKSNNDNDEDELAAFGLGDLKTKNTSLPFKTIITVQKTVEVNPSSLDKMLDDYFSENFGGNTVKIDQTFEATFELNSLSDSKGLATLSKTDSIKIDDGATTTSASTEHAAFSLSDLANQYLSGSNSSAAGFMRANMGSADKLNAGVAQSFGDKPISTSVKTNGESLFQLSLENLLNRNPTRPRTIFSRSSHNSESGLNEDVRSSREAMTPASFKMPNLNELKLIPPNYLARLSDDKRLELLKHLFIITDKSTFGDILSLNDGRLASSISTFKFVENSTNESIEYEFNYSTQKTRFKRKLRLSAKATSTDSEIENEKPAKKVKASEKLVPDRPKPSRKRTEALKPFDFSVPSPDDIVIAKQKLAFKRFK